MEMCIKKETGCLLKPTFSYQPAFQEICIKRNNTVYFYYADERKRSYFLQILMQEYRFFAELISDSDLKSNMPPFLYYLLFDRFVSVEELKCYLQNKPIERLEQYALRDMFLYDNGKVLYDSHIPEDMKKSIVFDYLSLCMEHADVFHTMLLKRMEEDIGLLFENTYDFSPAVLRR